MMPKMLLTEEDLKQPAPTVVGPINLLADQASVDKASTTQHPLLQALGGVGRAAVEVPAAAGQELAQQLSNLVTGAVNIPRRIAGAQPLSPFQVAEAPGRRTLPGKVGGVLGDILGYGGTAAAMGPLGLAESLTPLGEQAAIGATYGATQAPQAPERGAVIGGLAGAGLHLGGVGAGKLAQAASKRAEVIYPQARAALDNMLTRFRGSSSKETSAQDIYDIAAQHFEELRGKNKRDDIVGIGRWVQPEDSIRAAYAKPMEMAQEQKLKINSQPYLDKMEALKKEEIEEGGLFEGPEELDEDQVKTMNYLNKWLKLKTPTFDKVDLAKRRLNKDFKRFKYDDQRRHIAMEAKEGLRDSVRKSSIDSVDEKISKLTSENKEANAEKIESLKNKKEDISKSWEEADRKYKENLVPFMETPGGKAKSSPFYNRYAKGRPVSGMAEEYLRPGKQKDQFELVNNLMHMMPDEESKNLIAYHHFRTEEGDPAAFIKKYMKLGENQKNIMFNEQDKATLDNYSKLHESNPDLFKEPAKKGGLGSMFGLGRQALGVGGIAGGHIAAGTAILGYPLLKRLGLGATGRLAETGAATALSPTTRALIMSQLLKERGNE
jgi:hypothetical protein